MSKVSLVTTPFWRTVNLFRSLKVRASSPHTSAWGLGLIIDTPPIVTRKNTSADVLAIKELARRYNENELSLEDLLGINAVYSKEIAQMCNEYDFPLVDIFKLPSRMLILTIRHLNTTKLKELENYFSFPAISDLFKLDAEPPIVASIEIIETSRIDSGYMSFEATTKTEVEVSDYDPKVTYEKEGEQYPEEAFDLLAIFSRDNETLDIFRKAFPEFYEYAVQTEIILRREIKIIYGDTSRRNWHVEGVLYKVSGNIGNWANPPQEALLKLLFHT